MSLTPFSLRAEPSRTRNKVARVVVPLMALSAAIAVTGALTPVSAAAHSQSDTPSYVNTQFMEERQGEESAKKESGRLIIRNTSVLPRTVYARFQMPDDPNNRNYGFYQTIAPLSQIAYELPLGVKVFACDGKYWDNYRPDEAFAVTIAKADTYQFTHSQFKPSAIRRANGFAGTGA